MTSMASVSLETNQPEQQVPDSELADLKRKITKAVEDYNSDGIPEHPGGTKIALRDRLLLTFKPKKNLKSSATRSRQERARNRYLQVLDTDPHLFLAFITAVPPSSSIRLQSRTIQTLIQHNEQTPVRLRLDDSEKEFFKSVAEGQLADDQRYVNLVGSLFPEARDFQNCDDGGRPAWSATHLESVQDGLTFRPEKRQSTDVETQEKPTSKRPKLSSGTDIRKPVIHTHDSSIIDPLNMPHRSIDEPPWNGISTFESHPFLDVPSVDFFLFLESKRGGGGTLQLICPHSGSPLPWIEVRSRSGELRGSLQISTDMSAQLIKFVLQKGEDR